MADWDRYLTAKDRAVLERAKFGGRVGFGSHPALIVIDAQNYMVGERSKPSTEYPSACGEAGWRAIDNIARLAAASRAARLPIFYTRFELEPSGHDAGVYGLKRGVLQTPYWCLAGTVGADIVPEIAPKPGDFVFIKKKPSAFHGTPLLGYLIDRRIDTVIVTGGSTSNCVRATVFDASSFNYRTIVAADAVFDRIEVSHVISLFDMDRQFADVMSTDDVIAHLQGAISADPA